MPVDNANGSGERPKVPDGDSTGKDDTLAKATGLVIATGIAYSLYRSFFVGHRKEEHHVSGEPFHEQIKFEKPEGLSELEAKGKAKAGEFKDKAGDLKGSLHPFESSKEDKPKESPFGWFWKPNPNANKEKEGAPTEAEKAKEAVDKVISNTKGKVEEIVEMVGAEIEKGKDSLEDTKDHVANQGAKAKESGFGWFRKITSEANKEKEELATEAEKAKNAGKDALLDSKDYAAKDGAKAKETGFNWFGKATSEADKEKEEVVKGVEKAKDAGEDAVEDSKEYASKEGAKAKDTGFNWFRNFFSPPVTDKDGVAAEAEEVASADVSETKRTVEEKGSSFFDKAGGEVNKGKETVKGAVIGGGKNVEKGASLVAGKASELASFVVPGGKSKTGESAWSKTRGSNGEVYGIVPGDTLWSIARKFGVSIERLKAANDIWDADYIVAGDTLNIPK